MSKRSETAGMTIRDVPPDVKAALRATAIARGVSLNYLCVSMLAKRFGGGEVPPGRPSSGIGNSNYLGLTMPRRLRNKITSIAKMRDVQQRDLVLETWCDELGLRAPVA